MKKILALICITIVCIACDSNYYDPAKYKFVDHTFYYANSTDIYLVFGNSGKCGFYYLRGNYSQYNTQYYSWTYKVENGNNINIYNGEGHNILKLIFIPKDYLLCIDWIDFSYPPVRSLSKIDYFQAHDY